MLMSTYKKVMELVEQRIKYEAISLETGVSVRQICRIARQAGHCRYNHVENAPERMKQAKLMRDSGFTHAEICSVMNCTKNQLQYLLYYKSKKASVERRHPNRDKIIELIRQGKTTNYVAIKCQCSPSTVVKYRNAA